jgi:hypothetical protein
MGKLRLSPVSTHLVCYDNAFLPVTLLTAHPPFMGGALSFLGFHMADCFVLLA